MLQGPPVSGVVQVARAAPADRCRALSSEVLGPQGLAAGGARALGAGFGAPRGELRRPGKSVSLASLTSDEGDGFAPPAARSEDGERWRAPRGRLGAGLVGWMWGHGSRANRQTPRLNISRGWRTSMWGWRGGRGAAGQRSGGQMAPGQSAGHREHAQERCPCWNGTQLWSCLATRLSRRAVLMTGDMHAGRLTMHP